MSEITKQCQELAALIRKGAAETGECRGVWWDNDWGDEDLPFNEYKVAQTCALGAAMFGAGLVEPYYYFADRIRERFPILKHGMELGGDELMDVIIDRHNDGESRESIADWLDTL